METLFFCKVSAQAFTPGKMRDTIMCEINLVVDRCEAIV
jgi:hypothetical protein